MPAREVEPDHGVGGFQHEIAELVSVAAVDHPGVIGDDRRHAGAQLQGRRLDPSGSVVERIELDERHVESARELQPDRRLPAAGGRRDDGHLPHAEAPSRRVRAARVERLLALAPDPIGSRVRLARDDFDELGALVERGCGVVAGDPRRGSRRARERCRRAAGVLRRRSAGRRSPGESQGRRASRRASARTSRSRSPRTSRSSPRSNRRAALRAPRPRGRSHRTRAPATPRARWRCSRRRRRSRPGRGRRSLKLRGRPRVERQVGGLRSPANES